MMNELEFRRRVQLNPFELDAECQAFLDAAEPKLQHDLENYRQRCATEQQADLRDIRAALSVQVPDGLAERALLRTAHRRDKNRWFGWLGHLQIPAALASIALAVGAGWFIYDSVSSPGSTAAQIAVNHIHSEPAHQHLSGHSHQSPARVQSVFNRIGLRLDGQIAKVDFAANCDVEGRLGAHLLLERNGKPVTVLVYPQKDRSEAGLDHGGEMVAMPYGSLAVFADDDSSRHEVLNFFKQNLAPSQVAMLTPW